MGLGIIIPGSAFKNDTQRYEFVAEIFQEYRLPARVLR